MFKICLKLLLFLTFIIAFPNYSTANNDFKHGISIFGDLKYKKNFKHFDYVNPSARKHGHVRLASSGTFNSLNPFILKGIAPAGIDYLYDSLMENSLDEPSSMYPLVAKAVKINNRGLWVTFLLDKRARFSDGKKITAKDVAFSFKTLRDFGHPSYKVLYSGVEKVEEWGSFKVRFILKNNWDRKLPLILASMPILPKHYYEKHQFDKTSMDIPTGSGPYLIESVDPGKSIIYKRNEKYWARDLPVNKGRYNFDKIQYDYYLDDKIMIESFKAGNFDVRQENTARNWANSYNIDKIKSGEIVKRKIQHSQPAAMQTFVLNLRKEKFQDKNLRKAMTYAFNFNWIRKHIFYGSYKRTNSYFANSEFSYDNFSLPEFDENDFGRQNLLKAKKILDESGYKVKNGQLISPITKKPVEFEFMIASKAFEMIIAPFIDNLKKLGIKATMKLTEENQYLLKLRNFDYDIIVAVFPPASVPGSNLKHYWHSSQVDIMGSQNYSGLKNTQIDQLIEKITKAKTKHQLIVLCKKFDKIMLENYYTIPQWYLGSYRVLYQNKFAMPTIQPKYSIGFDTWWLK